MHDRRRPYPGLVLAARCVVRVSLVPRVSRLPHVPFCPSVRDHDVEPRLIVAGAVGVRTYYPRGNRYLVDPRWRAVRRGIDLDSLGRRVGRSDVDVPVTATKWLQARIRRAVSLRHGSDDRGVVPRIWRACRDWSVDRCRLAVPTIRRARGAHGGKYGLRRYRAPDAHGLGRAATAPRAANRRADDDDRSRNHEREQDRSGDERFRRHAFLQTCFIGCARKLGVVGLDRSRCEATATARPASHSCGAPTHHRSHRCAGA